MVSHLTFSLSPHYEEDWVEMNDSHRNLKKGSEIDVLTFNISFPDKCAGKSSENLKHNRFGEAGNWHQEDIFIYDELNSLEQSNEKKFQFLHLEIRFLFNHKTVFPVER